MLASLSMAQLKLGDSKPFKPISSSYPHVEDICADTRQSPSVKLARDLLLQQAEALLADALPSAANSTCRAEDFLACLREKDFVFDAYAEHGYILRDGINHLGMHFVGFYLRHRQETPQKHLDFEEPGWVLSPKAATFALGDFARHFAAEQGLASAAKDCVP